jgi:integrase/recombinase XerD
LLYHALRREELCTLARKDLQDRRGVPHLVVHGKGGKTRYVPLHPAAGGLIHDYLEAELFRPIHERHPGDAITADGVYKLVRGYLDKLGFKIGAHALRATAATNALDHRADIAKVHEWLGHANIATTRFYDRRTTRPEDSPTFKVSY